MADKKNRSGLGGRGLDAIFGTNVEQFLDEIQNSRSEGTAARSVPIRISRVRNSIRPH